MSSPEGWRMLHYVVQLKSIVVSLYDGVGGLESGKIDGRCVKRPRAIQF